MVNVLPRAWLRSEGSTAFLGRLQDFLVRLAGKLNTTSHAAQTKDVCELLRTLGAQELAAQVAQDCDDA